MSSSAQCNRARYRPEISADLRDFAGSVEFTQSVAGATSGLPPFPGCNLAVAFIDLQSQPGNFRAATLELS